MLITLLAILTGLLLVQLLPSRIKDNVDHAGHSQQPVLSKLLTRLRQINSSLSPNNNLLIVQVPMETRLVMEV